MIPERTRQISGGTPIERLLPHGPEICFLQDIVHCHDDVIDAVACVPGDSPWSCDGAVPEAVLLECLAQAAAALHGLEACAAGRPAGRGFLVAAQRVTFPVPAPAGVPLALRVQVTRRLVPFTLVEGQACGPDGAVHARGELRFFLPDDAPHATT